MKASGRISGETLGRPPPGPVVPGDQEVPAGAISRAKISSAPRSAWSATTRIITSRAAPARLCGPYEASAPSTSMWVALKSAKPASASSVRVRSRIASAVRRAFAAASMPTITSVPAARKPCIAVAETL